MANGPITALVLAGTRAEGDPVAKASGVSCKALTQVAGQPMLGRVLGTLARCPSVSARHLCIAPEIRLSPALPEVAAAIEAGKIVCRQPGASPSASVGDTFAALPPGAVLLVTTADHPLLTPEMVEFFLARVLETDAEVVAGVARADAVQAAYPQTKRTRLAFADGGYSGCNLFAFRGPGVCNVLTFWRQLEGARKRPWRLAMGIGPGTLWRYAHGRLTLAAAVERLGQRTQARLRAVDMPWPEAAIDVDTPADLALVETILSRRQWEDRQDARL